eukprot:scaffold4043_cov90-Isochrysis_galbana.AAC.4
MDRIAAVAHPRVVALGEGLALFVLVCHLCQIHPEHFLRLVALLQRALQPDHFSCQFLQLRGKLVA